MIENVRKETVAEEEEETKQSWFTLIQKVEASLKQSSATNNNYAVVGFGGEGELHAPHVFTSASKVFNDHNSIQAALIG